MKHKLFCIFDKVSKSYMTVTSSPTAESCVRENIKFLVQTRPLRDLELYELGSIDVQTMECTFVEPVLIPWDCYNAPLSPAESLAPLNIPQEEFNKAEKKSSEV